MRESHHEQVAGLLRMEAEALARTSERLAPTDGDLRRALQRVRLEDLAGLTAEGLMTREPVVVRPDLLAHAALQLMENRPSQIAVLPVVDEGGRPVGLLRIHDIVRSGL